MTRLAPFTTTDFGEVKAFFLRYVIFYMVHAPKCFVSKYTEKDLKGTRGSGFPVDCNSDSEEHMQLLNHTAGLRNEILRIN